MTRNRDDINPEDVTIREGSTTNQHPVDLWFSYRKFTGDRYDLDAAVTWEGYWMRNSPPSTAIQVIQDWILDKFPAPDGDKIVYRYETDPTDREPQPFHEWRDDPAFDGSGDANISEVAYLEWREDEQEWIVDCDDDQEIMALAAD